LWATTILTPADCINSNGDWTKLIPERLSEEERGALTELNGLCDGHIITDHLS